MTGLEQFTAWRIRALDAGVGRHKGLDVQLVVDTTAQAIVDAIERAARDTGIVLERVASGSTRGRRRYEVIVSRRTSRGTSYAVYDTRKGCVLSTPWPSRDRATIQTVADELNAGEDEAPT